MEKKIRPPNQRTMVVGITVALLLSIFFLDGPLEGLVLLAIAFIHWKYLRHKGSAWVVAGFVTWAIGEVMPYPSSGLFLIAGALLIVVGIIKDIVSKDDDDDGEAELVEEEQEKQLAERQRALNPAKDTV